MSKTYFDKVRSEGKAHIAITGGHFACFTNSREFVAALRQHVLPLVQ